MKIFFLTICVLLLGVAPVSAQDSIKSALDLPAGQVLVNLSASERREVAQDLLVANLSYQAENKDARALQEEINRVMKAAVEKGKTYKTVKLSTGQYYVYPYELPVIRPVQGDKRPQPQKPEKTWRGSQTIQLEGKAPDDVLALAGALQDMGLVMNGLNYTLSPELAETTRDELLEAALVKLKAKAERTARALGKGLADLIEINVDSGAPYYPPVPMMRSMAAMEMAADMKAAPVAEAGTTDITLSVSARAVLKP